MVSNWSCGMDAFEHSIVSELSVFGSYGVFKVWSTTVTSPSTPSAFNKSAISI
jgi:hypothetical protein